MKKVQLNLGCGIWVRKDFTNLDLYDKKELFSKKGPFRDAKIETDEYIQGDILHLPFTDNYADYVELIDVIEHFSFKTVIPALTEICRVMKKGGKLVLMTINMNGLAVEWLEMKVRDRFDINEYMYLMEAIYGNQRADTTGEFHRCAFTPEFLVYCLTQAGFSEVGLTLLDKDAKSIPVGTIPARPKTVSRNFMIIAEVVK